MSTLLRVVGGLLLWAAAFAALYGLQGLGCALEWQRLRLGHFDVLRATLVIAWLAFLGGALQLARRARRRDPPGDAGGELVGPHDAVLGRLRAGIALVGLAATAYTLFPVVWTSPCT